MDHEAQVDHSEDHLQTEDYRHSVLQIFDKLRWKGNVKLRTVTNVIIIILLLLFPLFNFVQVEKSSVTSFLT